MGFTPSPYKKTYKNVKQNNDSISHLTKSFPSARAREIHSLLQFTEDLAEINDKPISDEFEKFKKRVRKGYNEEQVVFYDLKGFGRNLIRELWRWCHDKLILPPYNYRGTMWQMLLQLKATQSENDFIRILSRAPNARART